MSQLKFGDELDWRTSRPNLVPTFHGTFTPVESGRPNRWYPSPGSEVSRRFMGGTIDGPKPQYKMGGIPVMNSSKTYPNTCVGVGEAREYETFYTAEGAVKLPKQKAEVSKNNFLPDIASVELATHAIDTRLEEPPSRYYNHR